MPSSLGTRDTRESLHNPDMRQTCLHEAGAAIDAWAMAGGSETLLRESPPSRCGAHMDFGDETGSRLLVQAERLAERLIVGRHRDVALPPDLSEKLPANGADAATVASNMGEADSWAMLNRYASTGANAKRATVGSMERIA